MSLLVPGRAVPTRRWWLRLALAGTGVAVALVGLPSLPASAAPLYGAGPARQAPGDQGAGSQGPPRADIAGLNARLAQLDRHVEPPAGGAGGTSVALGPEVMSAATQYSSTFLGSDGTYWTEYSASPLNYKDSSGRWAQVDPTLHPVPGGGYISGANSWHVSFSPLGNGKGGMTLLAGGHQVGFVPEGAGEVAPALDPTDRSRVVYKDAWPGTDLSYTVSATGVEEDIVLSSASSPSQFGFNMTGAGHGQAGSDLAGQGAGLPPGWHFVAPYATGRGGRPLGAGGPTLRSSGHGAVVSLGPKWLRSLPKADFPVDVDPSVTGVNGVAPLSTACYSSAGKFADPCLLSTKPHYVGADVGWDGTADWQSEVGFSAGATNPVSGTAWEPSGCSAGEAGGSPWCTVVNWAQVGLGTGAGAQAPPGAGGYMDLLSSTGAGYNDVGPYVLASASATPTLDANGAVVVALREAASRHLAHDQFPCANNQAGAPANLGDFWQALLCGGGDQATFSLAESASEPAAGSASSSALTCDTSTGAGCGAFQGFQFTNFWLNYDFAPQAPSLQSPPDGYQLPLGYTNVGLSATPVVGPVPAGDNVSCPKDSSGAYVADADGDCLQYQFVVTGTDGSVQRSPWLSPLDGYDPAWEATASPGVAYTWQVLVSDGTSVVIAASGGKAVSRSFYGPDGSAQAVGDH
jgi:hypothetical protein